jgi:MFS superfamily sulfate permease-like transporter
MSTFLTILAAVLVAALLVGVIVSFALLKSDHNRVPDRQSQRETGESQYDGNDGIGFGGAD